MPLNRLLYADDDPDSRELLQVSLRFSGFDVVSPATPQLFLKLAETEDWDVFVLDLWMPGATGFDLCCNIRRFDTRTPIVFYTGSSLETDKQKALDCGAADYIVKPLDFDAMATRLHAVIDRRIPEN